MCPPQKIKYIAPVGRLYSLAHSCLSITVAHAWKVPLLFCTPYTAVTLCCCSAYTHVDIHTNTDAHKHTPQQVCAHGGIEIEGPDSRDCLGGPSTVSAVSEFASKTLRGVATRPSVTEYCMYTVSHMHHR